MLLLVKAPLPLFWFSTTLYLNIEKNSLLAQNSLLSASERNTQ